MQAFHQELVRAVALGADYLVVHPGSGREGDRNSAVSGNLAKSAAGARGLRLGDLQILLENTAGQGTSVGWRFEEMKAILEGVPDLRIGVCIDTAHVFASGWDIRSAKGSKRRLRLIDSTVGLDRVFVIHVNDSKTPLGSRVDRHEHIGKGKIGLEAFGENFESSAAGGARVHFGDAD